MDDDKNADNLHRLSHVAILDIDNEDNDSGGQYETDFLLHTNSQGGLHNPAHGRFRAAKNAREYAAQKQEVEKKKSAARKRKANPPTNCSGFKSLVSSMENALMIKDGNFCGVTDAGNRKDGEFVSKKIHWKELATEAPWIAISGEKPLNSGI